jgi:hypothetical protein
MRLDKSTALLFLRQAVAGFLWNGRWAMSDDTGTAMGDGSPKQIQNTAGQVIVLQFQDSTCFCLLCLNSEIW